MSQVLQDCRYGWRMLRKNAGLTVVVVLSLAIGIGANSAIFSVVDALLLRPLPYPESERLANIWLHSPGIGIFRDWPSPGQYADIQKEHHSFEEMAIARLQDFTLTGLERPERIDGVRASSSLFHMLGARLLLGRLLGPEDDKPGDPHVVVLSYELWKRLFSGDPNMIGKSIRLRGEPYTVVGVLRPEFRLSTEVMPSEGPMEKADLFLPLPFSVEFAQRRGDENYNVMVRLKRGVTVAEAQADIDVIAARIREKDKRDRTFGMTVVGLQEQVVGDVRRAVLVLLGSVAMVLLIACANVANLLLARAAGREKEIAIRTALGAGGLRIARQLLTESLLLAVAGGAAGLMIARVTLYMVRAINPGNIPRLEDIEINGAVLGFTFGISIVTGILFGLAPAWRAMKVDVNGSLKSGGRNTQSDGGLRLGRHQLRGLLVAAELAFSLMLLVGAGLLIRSFVRLESVPPGYTTEHVLTMNVWATGPKYREERATIEFFQEIARRIARLPGVQAEGTVSGLPLAGSIGWGGIHVEGYTPPAGQELQVDTRTASVDYFRTMEIPLVRGRFFSEDDQLDSPRVAIIDAKFAQRFWPHDDPIGKHLWFDPKKPIVIAGVVGVVKQYGLDMEDKIAVYFPAMQDTNSGMYLAVRTSSDEPGLANAITREIRAVDADTLISEVRTMEGRLHDSLARQRFSMVMLGAFAAFALLLAAVGVYGVMSYLVAQSTHDIGVRMALGADAGNIVALVVRQGMTLGGIGIAAGLIGAALVTRVMASLLFGVSEHDGLTFSAVALILAASAFVATVVPAWRAARVDPMAALREE